ncbi:glycosyltransferase [Desulfonatronum sp. SC1]|uniref:glycosyltransferase n=1 Tax=Desulfonatronum sp. SC1 TaxID=2109626 RepID=UPI000D314A52|nr:glycosyltransferase [Desulfonatronum sp. SC1]PTN34156.1 hypothetical protein C6366_13520 [Desulfonatronum sp. SC1]
MSTPPPAQTAQLITEAEQLLKKRQYDVALRISIKLLQHAPDSIPAMRVAGLALLGLSKAREAQTFLSVVFQSGSNDWEIIHALAHTLRMTGDRLTARHLLSRFVETQPRHEEAVKVLKSDCNHYFDFYHIQENSGRNIHDHTPRIPTGHHPLFSVITVSLNQAQFIEDTIRAVMWQDFPSYEHLVIDGGSSDVTLDILRKYPHLKWTSEPDRGQSHALNKGFSMARGEIIAWINSDDFYTPETFKKVAQWFRQHPNERIIMGDSMWIFEQTGRQFLLKNREKGFEDIIRNWDDFFHPSQQSLFFKRSLLEEVGLLDETLHYTMDWDLFLRMTRVQPIRYIPELFSAYRFHGQAKGGSGEDWSDFYPDQQRVYARYKKHSKYLPQQPLLTVALPLPKPMMGKRQYLDNLNRIAKHISTDIMRDMEILIVTDGDPVETMQRGILEGCPVSCRFVQGGTHGDGFIHTVLKHARGYALHFPPLDRLLPLRWYTPLLNHLIDYPNLTHVQDRKVESSQALLPNNILLNSTTLYRTGSLQESAGKWTFKRPSALPELSVVVATRKRADVLKRFLQSLVEQTLDPQRFELIIVDDGSSDDTPKILQEFENNAPFYYVHQRHEKNVGPGPARNRGISIARAPILVFLNDDALLDPDGLTRHLNMHYTQPGKRIAVLGRFSFAEPYVSTPFGFLLERSDLLFEYANMKGPGLYSHNHFYACNISVPARAVREVGMFDDEIRPPAWGAEDIDLGFRLSMHGYGVLYDCRLVAWHCHDLDAKSFEGSFLIRSGGAVAMFAKNPELTCHYAEMSGSDLQRVRKMLSQVKPAAEKVARLVDAICSVSRIASESKNWTHHEVRSRIDLNYAMNQWRMQDKELQMCLKRFIINLQELLIKCSNEDNRLIEGNLDLLYESMHFMRWHFDTRGICASPWIEKFIDARK